MKIWLDIPQATRLLEKDTQEELLFGPYISSA
jgi:hypothetical protein